MHDSPALTPPSPPQFLKPPSRQPPQVQAGGGPSVYGARLGRCLPQTGQVERRKCHTLAQVPAPNRGLCEEAALEQGLKDWSEYLSAFEHFSGVAAMLGAGDAASFLSLLGGG